MIFPWVSGLKHLENPLIFGSRSPEAACQRLGERQGHGPQGCAERHPGAAAVPLLAAAGAGEGPWVAPIH